VIFPRLLFCKWRKPQRLEHGFKKHGFSSWILWSCMATELTGNFLTAYGNRILWSKLCLTPTVHEYNNFLPVEPDQGSEHDI
jgi:hypothetical protein